MPHQDYYPVSNMIAWIVAVAALVALAVYTWKFRQMPGAKITAISQLCKAVWLLSLVFATIHTELSDKLFWIIVQKEIALPFPFLCLLFILQISGQEKKFSSAWKYGFGAILIGLAFVILDWQNASLDGQVVRLIYGREAWILQVYTFSLGIINMVLIIRWIAAAVGLRRKQALLYSLAILVSWVGYSIWNMSVDSAADVLPWSFLLSGVILTWLYFRWQFYDILPLAQAVAARNVIQGLLVIDGQDYIIDINPAAQAMLSGLSVTMGERFSVLAAAWPALAEADSKTDSGIVETVREHSTGRCYYQLRRIPLHNSLNHLLGRIILLKDITEQMNIHNQMIEKEKTVAIMEERAYWARELHDNLCQVLGYINVQSQSVMKFTMDGQTEEALAGLKLLTDVTQRTYDDVRTYIRSVQTGRIMENGLVEALREYIGRVQREYGLDIMFNVQGEFERGNLGEASEMQLLRIVQEALTNIRKHAEASQVWIEIMTDLSMIQVSVSDDGKGFEPAACFEGIGFGFTSMRERAATIGGELEIFPIPGRGTKVVVSIPRMDKAIV